MKTRILLIVLLQIIATSAIAVGCISTKSGFWSDSTTWINCPAGIPPDNDSVVIRNGDIVTLDQNTSNLEAISVVAGGVLKVGGSYTINSNANPSGADFDFEFGSIVLEGDLTIDANAHNIKLGAVDGGFGLTLNSSVETRLLGPIGAASPLSSLTTDSLGATVFADTSASVELNNHNPNMIVDGPIAFHDPILVAKFIYISGNSDSITFDSSIDSEAGNVFFLINNVQNANIEFNGDVGTIQRLSAIVIINSETSTVHLNAANYLATKSLSWRTNVVLGAADITLNTNEPGVVQDNYVIMLGNSSTNYLHSQVAGGSSLTINAIGTTYLNAVIGGDNLPLANLSINQSASIVLKSSAISVIDTITMVAPVTMTAASVLEANIIDIQSTVDNGGFDLTVDTTANNGTSQINGVLSGAGNFIKNGAGGFSFHSINTITGNFSLNTGFVYNETGDSAFPGVPEFSLASDTFYWDGSFLPTPFILTDGQLLKGEGTCICLLTVENGATVTPGFSPGILFINTMEMETGSTLTIELNGTTAGSGYDQVSVVNPLSLDTDNAGGATLDVSLGFTPQLGDQFKIILIDDSAPITGTFNGLPEGQKFIVGDQVFSISYVGGDGNDVVLTVMEPIISVDINSTAIDGGDGLSWETAFINLQDALGLAISGMEIWVAQGVYYPDVGGNQTNNDQTATFTLIDGVSIYGGFDTTETDVNQRDPATNVTILSGDISQNDTDIDGNLIAETIDDLMGLNSYHILTGSAVDIATIIDGFTITAAHANGSSTPEDKGAGMYCGDDSSGPSINQVIFIGNKANRRGSATYGCSQFVTNSSFFNNYSGDIAGAVYAVGGIYDTVIFSGNWASGSAAALHNNILPITIKNSSFISNNANFSTSGALYSTGDVDLGNVLFSGNRANSSGGALYLYGAITANLSNVTMTGNRSGRYGGAIGMDSTTTLNLNNSIIWNNYDSTTDTTMTSSIYVNGGVSNQSNSLVQNFGTSVGNLDQNPLFITSTDPTMAPTSVGNAHLNVGSPAINTGDNSVVTSVTDLDGNVRIQDTTVDMGAYEFSSNTVSVTVTGLGAGSLVLQNNGADDLTFNNDDTLQFNTAVANTADYLVTVFSQSTTPNQECVISNGSGTIAGVDISVAVVCTTVQYTVVVDVSGLVNGVTLSLLNNAEALDVTANGLTNFATTINDGGAYAVSVTTQPSSPNQQCVITSNNASGNLSGTDETIVVVCTTVQYTVGVDVSGLVNGVTLSVLNNVEPLDITANGLTNFATSLDDLSAYAVSITTQPSSPNQQCVITSNNASGNLSGTDETIVVVCTTVQYTVGVDVSGLANGVTLSVLNNAEPLDVTANGLTSFATSLDDLSAYAVSVTTQPSSPNQQCVITSNNASGSLSGSDETIVIVCTTVQYTVGVDVSGLANGVTLSVLNNSEPLDVTTNGLTNFATAVNDGDAYAVSITTQPSSPNQECQITSNNAMGTLSGADITISINCIYSVYYVKAGSTNFADGLSWDTPFDNLQDALAIATSGTEIWVAQGVYYPDDGVFQTDNDKTATFRLIDGVFIYGGFNATETDVNQRDPTTNVTILSGDIFKDDTNTDGNLIAETIDDVIAPNSYHIVTGSSVNTITMFDGFTITAGQAQGTDFNDDNGAGMYCGYNTKGPSINQVTFIGNEADSGGSATYGCSQLVSNSSFLNNSSDGFAGAVFAIGGNYDTVVFSGNSTRSYGGSIRNNTQLITIKNSSFIANKTQVADGGSFYSTGDVEMENVLFSGNNAGNDGGAFFFSGAITATLSNVTMTGNKAAGFGGAIGMSSTATLNLYNSIIWNNHDSTTDTTATSSIYVNGGMYNQSNSLVQNFGISSPNNLDEDPLFITDTDPTTAPNSLGDARLMDMSIAIDAGDNTFVIGTTDLDGRERIVNGTVDMGAYEFFEEQVFKDGFE